jgi:hypothetical protein
MSVETHLSINLTAAWLSALTPPQLRLSLKLQSIRKSQLGASKIRGAFLFTLSAEKAALFVPRRASI